MPDEDSITSPKPQPSPDAVGPAGGSRGDPDWENVKQFLKLLGFDMVLFLACVLAAIVLHCVVEALEAWMPDALVLHALFKVAEYLIVALSVFLLVGSIMRRVGAYFGYQEESVRRWIFIAAIATVAGLGLYALFVAVIPNISSLKH